MARADDIGLFWEDLPPVKPPKVEKQKRTPPERTWELDDYLPGIEAARAFQIPLLNNEELWMMSLNPKREKFIFDIESYPNYFLAAFKSVSTGKILYFEHCEGSVFDCAKFAWVLSTFTIITFNGYWYDMPISALAAAGKTAAELQFATFQIIEQGVRPSDVLKRAKVKKLEADHIDLIEVAKGDCSLKIYAGRIHSKRMQDLPFVPGKMLSPDQMLITRWYCINDLDNTGDLHATLSEQLELREKMSMEYGIDLRSKSDAQIAEALIAQGVAKLNGRRAFSPKIPEGTKYQYKVPSFIRYHSPMLNWVLETVRHTWFELGDSGSPILPTAIKDLTLKIAGSTYQMGFGGLHSQEANQCHVSDDEFILIDRDVASYYPQIILNQKLYPVHLGPNFLVTYSKFVARRLKAKAEGLKVIADSLKIVINGGFGKLGSQYSILYSPDLMIQVTLTGQLALLMLIERIELAGIHVVSANTDGIVIKCPRLREAELEAIVKQWEIETEFTTEETRYKGLYSRDVNAYLAVKLDGGIKTKGPFANPWNQTKNIAERLEKNPTTTICVEALGKYLVDGTPMDQTIRLCNDVKKFVSIRSVKGGGYKDGVYLGKAIRWYYAAGEVGDIIYARSGNLVPRSKGAKPLMELPDSFPSDIDFDWYISEAQNLLAEVGVGTLTTSAATMED